MAVYVLFSLGGAGLVKAIAKATKNAKTKLRIETRIGDNPVRSQKLDNDFADSSFKKEIYNNDDLIEPWVKFDDAGLDALRTNPDQLKKFDGIVKDNNLGLTTDGLGDLLKAPLAKSLTWDSPENVLDAVKRASDSGVDGVSMSHKKFPEPAEGNTSFILSNAKQYQKEASGDAALSFDKAGTSFDNIDDAGKLIDRKYGHGSSIFTETVDDLGNVTITAHNSQRVTSILDQATRQVNAAGGSPVKWEISEDLGARGIRQVFDNSTNPLINAIEVVHVPQITIITP